MYNLQANDRFLPVGTVNMLSCSWSWQITDCPIMKKWRLGWWVCACQLPEVQGEKKSYFMFLSFRLCFQTNKIKCGWNIPQLWLVGTSNSSIKQMPLADAKGKIFICLGPKCFKYSIRLLSVFSPGPKRQRRDWECMRKPQRARPAKLNREFKAKSMHISFLVVTRLAKRSLFLLCRISAEII